MLSMTKVFSFNGFDKVSEKEIICSRKATEDFIKKHHYNIIENTEEVVDDDKIDGDGVCKNKIQEQLLCQMESRFLEVANLKGDLSLIPISKEHHLQVITNKEKSDKHGEVFTPLWLVDEMLDQISEDEWKKPELTTHDLCAGYGQFTVRMLRRRYHYLGEDLDILKVLSNYHLFSEIQLSSCFKLLYIFGTNIRLLIGDICEIGKLSDDAERGIWYWNENNKIWNNITKLVYVFFSEYNKKKSSITANANMFEKDLLRKLNEVF